MLHAHLLTGLWVEQLGADRAAGAHRLIAGGLAQVVPSDPLRLLLPSEVQRLVTGYGGGDARDVSVGRGGSTKVNAMTIMTRAVPALAKNGRRNQTAASSPPATAAIAVPTRVQASALPSMRVYSVSRFSALSVSKISADSVPEKRL